MEATETQKGTKELTEVVDLMLVMGQIVVEAKKDGKIGMEDVGLMLKLIPSLGPALDGIGEVPAEIKDLSVEEAEALAAHVIANLTVDNEKARLIIEKSLKAAIAIYDLGKAIKA